MTENKRYNDQAYSKTYKKTYENSENSDQHAHLFNLIRVFTGRRVKFWVLCFPNSPQQRQIKLHICTVQPDQSLSEHTSHSKGFAGPWLKFYDVVKRNGPPNKDREQSSMILFVNE